MNGTMDRQVRQLTGSRTRKDRDTPADSDARQRRPTADLEWIKYFFLLKVYRL